MLKSDSWRMRGWDAGRTEEDLGLTGGATDVDPQSQAAVAVVVGGRG